MDLRIEWLGRVPYREAWALQREIVAARRGGKSPGGGKAPDTLLLLEHEPVLTLGRHAEAKHVRASDQELSSRGIEVIRVERGGEVTYHGPGQLMAYPIVHLRERGILLRPFVRVLEAAMADVAAAYGVEAQARQGYPGTWVEPDGPVPRKLGALGLRVEKGITYHGIALNVTTQLRDFALIDPCGMADIEVTSIARELGLGGRAAEPTTDSVRQASDHFAEAFRERLAGAVAAALERAGAGAAEQGSAASGDLDGGLADPSSVADPSASTVV